MSLIDIPVKTEEPLVGTVGDVSRLVSASIVAEFLELLLYLVGFLLGDLGVLIPRDVVGGIDLIDELPVSEEEELILNDRSSEGKADGILILLVELLTVLDVLARSRAKEILVVVVVVDRPVEGIRPRLGDRVHPSAREARLTDIEGCDDDL